MEAIYCCRMLGCLRATRRYNSQHCTRLERRNSMYCRQNDCRHSKYSRYELSTLHTNGLGCPWFRQWIRSQLTRYSPKSTVLINIKINSITNSMELSPSWEAASCAAIQEFSNILCNPKVHYVFTGALHSSLSWARWIQSEIDFNIIHPPMSWSS
jgi:hypothetical protein